MKHHLSTILKLANSRMYNEKETKKLHEAVAWVNELVAENERLGWQYEELMKRRKEIRELGALLLKVGATTHKCKELHEWYVENVE